MYELVRRNTCGLRYMVHIQEYACVLRQPASDWAVRLELCGQLGFQFAEEGTDVLLQTLDCSFSTSITLRFTNGGNFRNGANPLSTPFG